MALVPDVLNKSYDDAAVTLSRASMGINVLGTNPPDQEWNGNWLVDYQTPSPGHSIDPVPIGYMVGVILLMPSPG